MHYVVKPKSIQKNSWPIRKYAKKMFFAFMLERQNLSSPTPHKNDHFGKMHTLSSNPPCPLFIFDVVLY